MRMIGRRAVCDRADEAVAALAQTGSAFVHYGGRVFDLSYGSATTWLQLHDGLRVGLDLPLAPDRAPLAIWTVLEKIAVRAAAVEAVDAQIAAAVERERRRQQEERHDQ